MNMEAAPPPPPYQSARARFRETVERAVPQMEIDQTKVLTDEELAALQKQFSDRKAAEVLAGTHDRKALRARLQQTVESAEQACFKPTSVFDALKKSKQRVAQEHPPEDAQSGA
jgi:hypothetical protein